MDKAKGAIKKAAGKLPGIETEEAQEGRSAREEGSATGHQEYFRDLIEETNRRSESGGLGGHAREGTGSETAGSREPLQEATSETCTSWCIRSRFVGWRTPKGSSDTASARAATLRTFRDLQVIPRGTRRASCASPFVIGVICIWLISLLSLRLSALQRLAVALTHIT